MSEAQAYSIYPITLAHPAFRPSEPIPVPGSQIFDGQGRMVRQDYRGTPQRFPPVTVHSEADEEYHIAQGYERAGKVDPSAWVKAHSTAPPEEYKPAKYPLWRDGQLIMTAQEDPEAGEEDLRADSDDTEEQKPPPAAQPDQDANLRAAIEEMNKTMKAMAERLAAAEDKAATAEAKNADLEAMVDALTAPADAEAAKDAAEPERRGPGRPRKTA